MRRVPPRQTTKKALTGGQSQVYQLAAASENWNDWVMRCGPVLGDLGEGFRTGTWAPFDAVGTWRQRDD